MATVTVKNIPEDLYERLKQLAEASHRSINSQIIVCIEQAVSRGRIDLDEVLASARQLRENTMPYQIPDEEFNDAKKAGRLGTTLMEITLAPDVERALAEQAQKQGTTPERLALDYLRERVLPSFITESETGEQGTLAEFLADHIGVLSSSEHVPGGARMSENSGKQFAAGLVKKQREERL